MNSNLIKIQFTFIQRVSFLIYIIYILVFIILSETLMDKLITISLGTFLYLISYIFFRRLLIIDLNNKTIEYRSYFSKRNKCNFSDVDKIIIKIRWIKKETKYEKRDMEYLFTIIKSNKRVLSLNAGDILYSYSLKLDRAEFFEILKEHFNIVLISKLNNDVNL